LHSVRSKYGLLGNDSNGKACQIIFALSIHAGHLGGLPPQERAFSKHAPIRDAADDRVRNVDVQVATGKVVEEEQWSRPTRDNVVHAHGNEVLPNRAVLTSGKGDLQFGPNAIGTANEQRLINVGRDAAQTRKSTDVGNDFRNPGPESKRLDPVN
jgi:hypothetical protein